MKLVADRKWLRKTGRFFSDLFFPRFCISCNKEGDFICKNCSLFLSEAGLICPVCEKGSYFGEIHKKCPKRNMPDGLANLWDYEGMVKNGIHQAKYGKYVFQILNELTDYFFLRIEENKNRMSVFLSFLFEEDTAITFVPVCRKSNLLRGFNQSEIIANNLAGKSGKETFNILYKKKHTISQTKLDREDRKKNVEGVFSVYPKKKVPQKIVLVDDIWTSGATMRECCRTLKENGAEKVWCFTLAKTP